ncbi:uncharacterized protein LOC130696554 [Daphnia carinata]|uniref:uncharacterized protein LOC130696554 n=1 Tax=Daphnia carinata TaxID=120202 RepID=UPI00257D804B|nr:uncharacterized protein LOC130696554 [Daphnia carinata]
MMGIFSGKGKHQSFVFLFSSLFAVDSFISAAMTRSLTPSLTRDKGLSITVHGVVATGDREGIEYNGEKNYRDHRPFSTARPITKRRPANWDPYVADTCGGTINIPLSFDRLSLFKSSGFPATRDYPLICNWNVKVNYNKCRRARITMRMDGRSRLADAEGCTKGHFTVSPFMKRVKICGRIGNIPPFHWYFDSQQAEKNVTITMKNIGINDGYSEGVSFTLQGECLLEKTYVKKMNAGKENDRFHVRWMSRLLEDLETGEGPRLIQAARHTTRLPSTTPRPSTTQRRFTTVRPSTTARPSTTQRPSTTLRAKTKRRPVAIQRTSTTTKRSISYVHPDLLWPFLGTPEPFIPLESLLDVHPSSNITRDTSFTVQSSTKPTVNLFKFKPNQLAPVVSSTLTTNLSLTTSDSNVPHSTNQSVHLIDISSGQSLNSQVPLEMNSTIPELVLEGQTNNGNPISYISLNGQKFVFSKFHKFKKLLS